MDTQNTSADKSFGEEISKLASSAAEHSRESAAELAKETETRFRQARRYAADKVEQLRRAAADGAGIVRQRASEGWDATCGRAKDLHKAGEEYVKANPTKAVLVTLGAGLVLGLLIGASRR